MEFCVYHAPGYRILIISKYVNIDLKLCCSPSVPPRRALELWFAIQQQRKRSSCFTLVARSWCVSPPLGSGTQRLAASPSFCIAGASGTRRPGRLSSRCSHYRNEATELDTDFSSYTPSMHYYMTMSLSNMKSRTGSVKFSVLRPLLLLAITNYYELLMGFPNA